MESILFSFTFALSRARYWLRADKPLKALRRMTRESASNPLKPSHASRKSLIAPSLETRRSA
jgi:hypothetical protein